MECKKCQEPGTVVLRKKDYYCNNCHITNTNHKFRACIGKNKILSSNEKVLICLSGGLGSTVLLDLVYNGLNMDAHRKLRITPVFLHLNGLKNSTKDTEISKYVIDLCRKYNFDIYIVHISDYLETSIKPPFVNCMPVIRTDLNEKFWKMFTEIPITTSHDFLVKVKQNLLKKYANLLNCKFLFTAETTTTLATNLLSNLAMGRGAQVENDIGFSDTRNKTTVILRPMKDISKEELDYYIKIKQLSTINDNEAQKQCLQSVISTFVTDLQDNFQSTISTVCKTADKLGVVDDCESNKKCKLCKSQLNTKNNKLTALEATKFSSLVSYGKLQELDNEEHALPTVNESIFPYINKYLCYACSKTYSNIKNRDILSLI